MKKSVWLGRLRRLAEETAKLRRAFVENKGQDIIGLAEVMSGVIGSGGKSWLPATAARPPMPVTSPEK